MKGCRFPLGTFEEIVMLAVRNLGSTAYGVTIRQKVDEVTGRTTSIGAVYITLDQLEEKGYVSSRIGEGTPERGGRAKKYFKADTAGIRALEETQHMRAILAPTGKLGLQ